MTRKLPITRGLEVLLDEADFVKLSKYRWCALMRGGTPYAVRFVSGKALAMHRVIAEPPEGMCVDHVNHNTLDNRRCNLRVCTKTENLRNRRSWRGASKFLGVSPSANKWRVNIQRLYVGTFETQEEAARAYDAKAREFYGEFANLNFPQSEEVAA